MEAPVEEGVGRGSGDVQGARDAREDSASGSATDAQEDGSGAAVQRRRSADPFELFRGKGVSFQVNYRWGGWVGFYGHGSTVFGTVCHLNEREKGVHFGLATPPPPSLVPPALFPNKGIACHYFVLTGLQRNVARRVTVAARS